MRLTLKLPPHMTFEEVVDGMAHAGWRVLTLPPELHHLYPGYWVAARAIIFEHMNRAKVSETVSPAHETHIHLADHRETGEFVDALSAAIMHRLEGAHCGTCGVECQGPHLPQALHHALHVYAKEDDETATGDSQGRSVPPPGNVDAQDYFPG